MDYDEFSSQESLTNGKGEEKNLENRRRFVILWHALPTFGEIEGTKATREMEAEKYGSPSFKSRSSLKSLKPLKSLPFPTDRYRTSHFDLMFEMEERLITFELPTLPIPGDRVPLWRLDDHRLHYLDYEGVLEPGPTGNARGTVTRWTSGHYQFYRWTKDKLIVELQSDKLSARIALVPGKASDGTVDTSSHLWPGVLRWELRAPRWHLI